MMSSTEDKALPSRLTPAPACAPCAELKQALSDAEAEKQHLLDGLAREKQRAQALLMAYPPHQVRTQLVLPMRYRAVDWANAQVRRTLPFMHRLLKFATSAIVGET